MTKEDLLAILAECTGADPEYEHSNADAILAYIDDPEITTAYNAIKKWYA